MKENTTKEKRIREIHSQKMNVNKEISQEGKSGFVQLVCNLFIITILAVLPLYTGEGYLMLGDRKYLVFRNIALLCLGLWLVVLTVTVLYEKLEKWGQKRNRAQENLHRYDIEGITTKREFAQGGLHWNETIEISTKRSLVEEGRNSQENQSGKGAKMSFHKETSLWGRIRNDFSIMDVAVLLYGVVCLLSFCSSAYRETAWSGYRDWYMGTLSQLLFVGIYFFVSREYRGDGYPIYLGELALGLVAVIAFLQKLQIDPLRLSDAYETADWGYSHMLSTVGNINWLCGYLAVALSLPVTGYLYSNKPAKRNILYVISVLGLALLCMQGSEIGLIIAAGCLGICLLAGLRKKVFFEKGLALVPGTLLCLAVLELLITRRDSMDTMPAEANIFYYIPWYLYFVVACVMGIVWLLFCKLPGKVKKPAIKAILVLGGFTITVAGLYLLSKMQFNAAWGSGRGGLWTASIQGFLTGDWKQKLIGAGPDCFAEYLYTNLDMNSILEMEGYWSQSVFANAHNEWLNTLVNLGLLGVAAFTGIFVCGLKRYRGMLLGLLVLGMYAINALVSFQQVMNAPLFFLILGLCENRLRRESSM